MWYQWALISCRKNLAIDDLKKRLPEFQDKIERCFLLLGRYDLALLVKSKRFINTFDKILDFFTEFMIELKDISYIPSFLECEKENLSEIDPNVVGLFLLRTKEPQNVISSYCDFLIKEDYLQSYKVFTTFLSPEVILLIEASDPEKLLKTKYKLSNRLSCDISVHSGIDIFWENRSHGKFDADVLIKVDSTFGDTKKLKEDIIAYLGSKKSEPSFKEQEIIEFPIFLRIGWYDYIIRLPYSTTLDLVEFANILRSKSGILSTSTIQYTRYS